MRRNFKFAMRAICFFIILFIAVLYTNHVLTLKRYYDYAWPSTSTYNDFYKMKNDSVDVIFLGSSHVVNSMNPQKIYDDYGIRSYNLGNEQQSTLVSYYWLKEALKTQKPKVVVMDTLTLFEFQPNEKLNSTESSVRLAIDPMHFSKNKLDAVKDICSIDESQSLESYLFKNLRYHTRWTELNEQDFLFPEMERHIGSKGFAGLRGTVVNEVYEPFQIGETSDYGEMLPVMENYLLKIVELCDAQGIELILVKTPAVVWWPQKNNTVSQFAQEHGIDFYDFNDIDLYNQINFDFYSDMADNAHTNIWGSEKISGFIGEVLNQKYSFGGVNDEQYEISKLNYQFDIQDYSLSFVQRLDEYLQLTNCERYLVLIVSKDDIKGAVSPEVKACFNAVGLEFPVSEDSSYCAVIDSNKVVYEQASDGAITYNGYMKDNKVEYKLTSGNRITGGDGSIYVGDKKESLGRGGLNFVVYDKITRKVVDAAYFDGEFKH